MVIALRAPADGPIGDSALVVSDGATTVFNMNDARPVDLDMLTAEFGHIDVHLLQYSGAIWYPMVYDMPARAKEAFGTQKRQRQMDRAGSTSPRSARPGWCRRPDRRAFWTPSCATSTTTTAIRPTSFPTRWCSWTRCAATGTTAAC